MQSRELTSSCFCLRTQTQLIPRDTVVWKNLELMTSTCQTIDFSTQSKARNLKQSLGKTLRQEDMGSNQQHRPVVRSTPLCDTSSSDKHQVHLRTHHSTKEQQKSLSEKRHKIRSLSTTIKSQQVNLHRQSNKNTRWSKLSELNNLSLCFSRIESFRSHSCVDKIQFQG
jgi:hypothetical protein